MLLSKPDQVRLKQQNSRVILLGINSSFHLWKDEYGMTSFKSHTLMLSEDENKLTILAKMLIKHIHV